MNMQPALRPRLSVNETVYYQVPNGKPAAVPSRFQRELSVAEQIYVREIVVPERWTPLDLGWIKQPSMILVHNPRPVFFREPSQEELDAALSKVVQLGAVSAESTESKYRTQHSPPPAGPVIVDAARPSESIRVNSPSISTVYMVRSLLGELKVTVTVLPA